MQKFIITGTAAILTILFISQGVRSYWQGQPLSEADLDNGVRYEMVDEVPEGILVFIRKMDDPDSEPEAFKLPRYYPCGFIKTENDEVVSLRDCKINPELGYLEPPISITPFPDNDRMSFEKRPL